MSRGIVKRMMTSTRLHLLVTLAAMVLVAVILHALGLPPNLPLHQYATQGDAELVRRR